MRSLLLKRVTPMLSKTRGCVAAWHAGGLYGPSLTPDSRLRDFISETHHAQLGSTSGAAPTDPLFLAAGPYLYLPGSSGNSASAPDAAALDITGDIDLRIKAALSDWTSGNQCLFSKWLNTGNQRSFEFYVANTGKLGLWLSSSGVNEIAAESTAATGLADEALKWVRATWRASDGRVQFFTSDDGTSWTQLGTDLTIAVASIFVSTTDVHVGVINVAGTPTEFAAGKFYNVQMYASLDGTAQKLEIDFADATKYAVGLATLTAVTGQTVTINRAATGRKSAIADRSLFLLGTDDYFEIVDHADLNFGVGDSFTLAVALRMYGTTADLAIAAKKSDLTTAAGYSLDFGTGGVAPEFTVADGTDSAVDVAPTITAGIPTVVAGRRGVGEGVIQAFSGGVGSRFPTTDATTATLVNSGVLRIGRLAGAGTAYGHYEFLAAALFFRRALSDYEMRTLHRELL